MPSAEGYPPCLRQSRASSVHASGTAQGIRGPARGDPSAVRLCRQREAIHRVWCRAGRQAFTHLGQRRASGDVRQTTPQLSDCAISGRLSTVSAAEQGVKRPRIRDSAGHPGACKRRPVSRATVPSAGGYPPCLVQSRASSVHASGTAQGIWKRAANDPARPPHSAASGDSSATWEHDAQRFRNRRCPHGKRTWRTQTKWMFEKKFRAGSCKQRNAKERMPEPQISLRDTLSLRNPSGRIVSAAEGCGDTLERVLSRRGL